jgi:hypothetical protein
MSTKSRKIYIIIGIYVFLLFIAGFILIFAVSGSKLQRHIEIFENKEVPLQDRITSLYRIAQHDEDAAVEIIIKALKGNSPALKIEASKLAKARRDFEAIPILIRNLNDNTLIQHGPSGTTLPMVKIASYDALKSITGKDFGVIESPDPIEIAQTIKRWESWWLMNAARFNMKPEDMERDYETLILNQTIPEPTRRRFLETAFRKRRPELGDIVIGLLRKENYKSDIFRDALILVSQLDLHEAIPCLITILNDDTYTWYNRDFAVSLPFPSIWANEALVQLTGKTYGPLYSGMDPKDKQRVIEQWKEYWSTLNKKGSPETGKGG